MSTRHAASSTYYSALGAKKKFDLLSRLEICGSASCGYPFLVGLTDAGWCVISHRNYFLHVFDRLGRCFFSPLLGISLGLLFDLYSWTTCLAFYSGLACRPADLLIALFRWSLFFEGLQSWLGGLESLALWLGVFCCLFCVFGQLCVSDICLSRDWA